MQYRQQDRLNVLKLGVDVVALAHLVSFLVGSSASCRSQNAKAENAQRLSHVFLLHIQRQRTWTGSRHMSK